MEFFAKIVNAKILHHKCSTAFQIHIYFLIVIIYLILVVLCTYFCSRMFQKYNFKITMYFKIVILRSFYLSNSKLPFSFWTQGFLLNGYLLHFCYLLVIRSYNNAMLSKFNTFTKSKLEVNWSKELKLLTDTALPIFFQKTPLIN